MDSSNFFSAKSLLPSALSASAITNVKDIREGVLLDSCMVWRVSAGSGGVLNNCSATELLVGSIGGAVVQPRYHSKWEGAIPSQLGLKGVGV